MWTDTSSNAVQHTGRRPDVHAVTVTDDRGDTDRHGQGDADRYAEDLLIDVLT